MAGAQVNYDFIVVGGGASGSALASNLATKGSTLLIEQGANNTAYPQSIVRQGWPQIATITLDPVRNKGSGQWTGTPNILGGGSAVNGAACWRGEPSIFSSLGFHIESVEEAFEYLEDTVCTPNDGADTEYMQAFYEAWEEHGFETVKSSSGFASWAESKTSRTIQRARSILPVSGNRRPANYLFEHGGRADGDEKSPISAGILNQGNLTVYLLTKAKRVLFDDENVAVGVEINSPAGDSSVYVRHGGKVFLNAGTYETPKLLMLSGIGPADTLSRHGISPVYINEAVGQNLIDRKYFAIQLPAPKEMNGDDIGMLDYAAITDDYWVTICHKNTAAWGNGLHGCSVCEARDKTQECAQQIVAALTFNGMGRVSSHLALNTVSGRRPLTRGNITLASSNYDDSPIVHDGWSMNYDELSTDALHDLRVIVNGVQDLIIDVLRNTTLLEKLGNPIGIEKEGPFDNVLSAILSGSRATLTSLEKDLDKCKFSDLYVGEDDVFCSSWDECVPTLPLLPHNNHVKVQELVFRSLHSMYDMAGTCQAGTVVEKGTLSVIGVKGLHIGDLSVLTQPVDTHSLLTAMSIGLMLGKGTDSIPPTQYESIPIILASFCMLLVALIAIGWIGVHTCKKYKRSRRNTLAARHAVQERSIHDIWAQEEFQNKIQTSRTLLRGGSDHTTQLGMRGEFEDHSILSLSPDNKTIPHQTSKSPYLMKWSGVSCSYKVKMPKQDTKKEKVTTTLSDNFGCMREGEVTAIMGPSGASKSTLLDILSGRKSVGKINGTFSVLGNNFEILGDNKESFHMLSKVIQSVSAYIPQQEFFYPTQTCEEAIAFTANMKFGRGQPDERTRMIWACLDVVGLDPEVYASRKIGGELAGGINLRGLSGGERKRLALACVLALKPKILFIDELTSGLDSENALLIMKLLKDLSIKMNVATIIIIHQPSSEIFALFDNLILLSKGRCLFSDSCSNLPVFYENNYDERLPMSTLLADDLVLKASSYDLSNEGETSNFFKCGIDVSYHPKDVAGSTKTFLAIGVDASPIRRKLFQLSVVFRRNLDNQYIKNISNVGARLASYSGLSAIVGTVFWRVGITESDRGLTYGEADILLRAALFLMNISYLLPFSVIPVFFADKRFFAAESALGLYPAWMYGLSQVFLEFLFLILTSTVEAAIVISMCGFTNPTVPIITNILTIASILIISGLVGSTLVFCLAMWLPTQDLTFLLGSTIVTVSLSLCGGFLPFTSMSDVSHTLQWLSPIKYSFQAMALALLKGTSSEKIIDIAGYNTPPSITENVWILCGVFSTLSILTVVGISKVKEVR